MTDSRTDPTPSHLAGLFLAMFIAIATLSPAFAQGWSLKLMAQTGPALPSIDTYVSINNAGVIAFSGTDSTGSRTFVVDSTLGVVPITFVASATRLFTGAAINNATPASVASRDRVSGSPPTFFVRQWPASGSQAFTVVGRSPTAFDSALPYIDLNDSGVAAFMALTNGSMSTALMAGSSEPPVAIALFSGTVALRPQISNSNDIVIRDDIGRIATWPYPSGNPTIIAAASGGFTLTGIAPGISSDGTVVAFAGDRGQGKGVFAGVSTALGRSLVRVAGEGQDAFTDITDSQRIGVVAQVITSDPLNENFTTVFIGTFAGVTGIYSIDSQCVEDPTTHTVTTTSGPVQAVARVGDVVGDPSLSTTITTVSLWDPIAENRHVAFRADLSSGTAAVIEAVVQSSSQLTVTSSAVEVKPSNTAKAGNQPFTLALTVTCSEPSACSQWKLELSPEGLAADVDGHGASHTADRPLGSLVPGTTGGTTAAATACTAALTQSACAATGSTLPSVVTFVAPPIAGTVRIKASCPDSSCLPTFVDVPVRIAGLLTVVSPLPSPVVVAPDTIHGSVNVYATSSFRTIFQKWAAAWYAKSGRSLVLTDVGLPWGGLFDLSGEWIPPHQTHRYGIDADIRICNLTKTERTILAKIIGGDSFPWPSESPNSTECSGAGTLNHWHVRPVGEHPPVPSGVALRSIMAAPCPTAPNLISPEVSETISFDSSKSRYTYAYTLSNLGGSGQSIDTWELHTVAPVTSIQKPVGWDVIQTASGIRWYASEIDPSWVDDGYGVAPPLYGVAPGQSMSGFSFLAESGSVFVPFTATGYVPLPAANTELAVEDLVEDCSTAMAPVRGVTVGPKAISSGDANGDATVNVLDIFYLLNHVFAGGPLPVATCDPDADGQVQVADIIYLINFLFAGGPPPA